jgi:hypothetical protein
VEPPLWAAPSQGVAACFGTRRFIGVVFFWATTGLVAALMADSFRSLLVLLLSRSRRCQVENKRFFNHYQDVSASDGSTIRIPKTCHLASSTTYQYHNNACSLCKKFDMFEENRNDDDWRFCRGKTLVVGSGSRWIFVLYFPLGKSRLRCPAGHEGLWPKSCTSPLWSLSSESVIYAKSRLFGIWQHGLQNIFIERPS